MKVKRNDPIEVIDESDLSDDSIEKFHEAGLQEPVVPDQDISKLDEPLDEEYDPGFGTRLRDFYGTNKLNLNNPEQLQNEYLEGEKLRSRNNELLTDSDFFTDYFHLDETRCDVKLVLRYLKEKTTCALSGVASKKDCRSLKVVEHATTLNKLIDGYLIAPDPHTVSKIVGELNMLKIYEKNECLIGPDEIEPCVEKRLPAVKIETNRVSGYGKKKKSNHPRVKNRNKFTKQLKKHNQNVKPIKRELERYSGEKCGIRKNVIHSVKLN